MVKIEKNRSFWGVAMAGAFSQKVNFFCLPKLARKTAKNPCLFNPLFAILAKRGGTLTESDDIVNFGESVEPLSEKIVTVFVIKIAIFASQNGIFLFFFSKKMWIFDSKIKNDNILRTIPTFFKNPTIFSGFARRF